jgi:hypothetical protein
MQAGVACIAHTECRSTLLSTAGSCRAAAGKLRADELHCKPREVAVLQGRWRRSSGRRRRSWRGCAPSAGGCSACGPLAKPRWPPCRCMFLLHKLRGLQCGQACLESCRHRTRHRALHMHATCYTLAGRCAHHANDLTMLQQRAGGERSAGGGGRPEAAAHRGADHQARPPGPRVRMTFAVT